MPGDWKGHDDGRNDAEFDVAHYVSRRPRPRFLPSLLSDSYRIAYMTAYRQSYDRALRRQERDISQELAARSKLIGGDQVPRDRVLERGWRDGFNGKDTVPKGYAHEEVEAYERGHRLGKQHRDFELANQLRQRSRHQHSR